ncbi:hypothetical protein ATK36_2710 [Amycolatopsis sulphurea]|uniref:Putative T7SS secretion signal domain-containing protein n=1 Tax=Amycolatopsis sulphurea TaxID=76022 RepID=A0A2A9F9N1_9PSEU|nr:hypothetical protein [Amycolatopsis sulphurea]PFG47663.1 hypothetical protein ATK36_2710 [Amycolatopsis sulphurea]
MGDWRFLDEIEDEPDGPAGTAAVAAPASPDGDAERFAEGAARALAGGSVDTQLGETDDPKELVHGDPDTLRQTGEHLQKFANAFSSAASGLTKVDTAHWSGDAADAFRAKFQPHPDQWARAADACGKAAGALHSYATAVQQAQQQAAEAAHQYAQAQQQSQQAVQAYERQLISSAENPPPFQDPGATGRQQAQILLEQARRHRDQEALAARAALDAGTAQAPVEPGFLDQLANDLGDGLGMVSDSLTHFAGGVIKTVSGVVKIVRTLNPLDPYNLTHPAEYIAGVSGTAAGLVQVASHPLDLLKGIVGSGWGSDPAEAFGKLTANIALVAATGGAGAAADVALSAGKVAVEAAGTAGREALEIAGREAVETAGREAVGAAGQGGVEAAGEVGTTAGREATVAHAPAPERPTFEGFGDEPVGDFGPQGSHEELPTWEPQPSHYGTPPEAKWDRSELIEQPDISSRLDGTPPEHAGHPGGHEPVQHSPDPLPGDGAGHQPHSQAGYENPAHHANAADHQAFNDKFGAADPHYLAERMAHAPDAGLAPEEVRALDHYTGMGHQDINAALRHGDTAALRGLDPEISEMASGLNKLPDFQGQVFRGIDIGPGDMNGFLDRYQLGAEVREPAFTSSDLVEPYRGNVQFTIDSVGGKDISWLKDAHVGQREVVFPPGSNFRVTSRSADGNGNWTIHLQDLGR